MISNEDIKREFLAAGFTVEPGNDDLNPCVYEAARRVLALVAADRAAAVAEERQRWVRLLGQRLDATVMSCYASTRECDAARAALRGVMVYENAA